MDQPQIVLVVAVADNGVIGVEGGMPWRISADFRRVKALTMGKPLVMGRKTFDSLPGILPGRRHIVITRDATWQATGAEAVHTLDEAIARCQGSEKLFVIGGAQLWSIALPRVDELVLTEIGHDFAGDAVFPPWDRSGFDEASRERLRAAAPNDFELDFVTYRRRSLL